MKMFHARGNFPQAALAMAVASLSATAFAQEQPGQMEEITVSGIRQVMAEAVDRKRDATEFLDAIMADDMGKLPDANVAESLQRVSGVQVDRGIGGGSDVSIRGMRQNVTLINGRQVIEAGGRGSRGPDTLEGSSYGLLAQIPSKLVSRLEVYKQTPASQIEGALGGVVDVVTRRPLDNLGHHGTVSLTGAHSQLAGETDSEWFAMYSGTFADDTFGVLVSATEANQSVREDGMNTFSGYGQLSSDDGLTTIDPNGDGVPGQIHRDMRFQQIEDDRKRSGVSAFLQWQPSDELELYADTFFSEITSDRNRYWTGFWNCCTISNPVFSDNETLMAAEVVRPAQTNTEFADASSAFTSTAIGGSYETERWSLSAELANTAAESSMEQDFIRFQTQDAGKIAFDLRNGDVPQVDFTDADLTNLDELALAILYDNSTAKESTDRAARFDFEWQLEGAITSIELGARSNTLETDVRYRSADIRPNFALGDLPDISTLFSSNDFFSGDAGDAHSRYLVVDKSAWQGCGTLADFYDSEQQAICNIGLDPLGSFTIDESIDAYYVKANYDVQLGDVIVTGDFGIRQVERNMTSTGNAIDADGGVSPTVAKVSNSETLPSAVAKFDLSEDWVVRVGAARALTFPNTADLNNGLHVFSDNTGQSGSPDLDPFIVNQMDLSSEWYFDSEAVLSAGVFFKDVESFIVQTIQSKDIPGYSDPITVAQKVNGEGGKVKGLELLYQQPLTFLPAGWDGLGVMTTYSYTDSETPFTDANGSVLPLPGLSKHNVNFVSYYETENLGFRVAYNWRDDYLDGIGNGDSGIYYKDYADLSATANWHVTDNLTVNLEALNLLNTRQLQYNAYSEATRRNVEYGQIYKVSFTYAL